MEKYKVKKSQKFYFFWKRVIGFFGSALGIILLSPIILIVTLINIFPTKGHPYFVQRRVGRNGKLFCLIKFRSMPKEAEQFMSAFDSNSIKTDCTKFGWFLRKTSLDEIPQLFNIFIGDMAFIGPRPLFNHGIDKETIEIRNQNGACHLRPGISGLAQINGRATLRPDLKGELDGDYFKNISFALDFKLFFKSISHVFKKKDDIIK